MRVYNKDHEITRGALSDEQKIRFEQASKSYEKLLAHVQSMSQSMQYQFPDLPADTAESAGVSATIMKDLKSGAQIDWIATQWEDDE